MEPGAVVEAGQLIDEADKLLTDLSSTGPDSVESSKRRVKWSSQRAARLTRMQAVDVDDSDSQTSSGCPASSSSTSTTPPASQHRQPVPSWPATAAVGGLPSVVAVCRVRPLTDVEWRRGGYLGAAAKTPSEAVPPSAGVRRRDDGDEPVRRELAITDVTHVTAGGRCIVSPGDPAPRSHDDDDVIRTHEVMMAESKFTVYDNVALQQLHV